MRLCSLLVAASVALSLASGAWAQDKPKIILGIVAKSQSNPVFQAAHEGAKAAAKELGDQYGVTIEINIQTPPTEDAQKQAQAIEQLAQSGVAGIAVSCSNANTCAPAIDKAVDAGVPVVCFDSDSPRSKRFAFYGTDDASCGQKVAKYLSEQMNNSGNVAILAGNESAPNLRLRTQGMKEEFAKHPDIKLIDIVYHEETPEKAAAAIQREQNAHPEIQGWGFIGGWPLFTRDALKWEPGTVKCVSVDALPPCLTYLEDGHVQVLLAQDCYGWGYKSVQILLDKIVKAKEPANGKVIDNLQVITKENAKEYGANWKKWLGQ
ncbi:MAG TPA: substrate-binding domain-containing protein [Phycisphaerae bacterium]|nr:substrate-binding domain-containing protein [Phycisphaerae bacterium]